MLRPAEWGVNRGMRRALLIAGFVLIAFIALVGWVYAEIQGERDDATDLAVKQALAETELVRADHVDYFAGGSVYYIVYGVNELNDKMIVWVGRNELHAMKADQGVTREQVRGLVQSIHGQVEWIRLIPGKYEDEFVWEAYFKKQEQEGTRPYYEYYRFEDGELLDSLRLQAE